MNRHHFNLALIVFWGLYGFFVSWLFHEIWLWALR